MERGLCGEIKVPIFVLPSVQDRFLFIDHPCFHFMVVATLPSYNYPLKQSVFIPCGAWWDEFVGGAALIMVNYMETICPAWKRNGRVGFADGEMDVR